MYYFGSPPADQLSKKIIKMTERSDIRKYSIFNGQFPDKAGFTLRCNRLVQVKCQILIKPMSVFLNLPPGQEASPSGGSI